MQKIRTTKSQLSFFLSLAFILLIPNAYAAETKPSCTGWGKLLKPMCEVFHHIISDGNNELYVSGYAWHNRYTYSPEKIKSYNEAAWGGGYSRGYVTENGDYHALAAFAFLDSHKNIEPVVGYLYLKKIFLKNDFKGSLGLAPFLTARPDIFKGRPFPGLMPIAALSYKKVTLQATYIPGAVGAGNVLFLFARYTF